MKRKLFAFVLLMIMSILPSFGITEGSNPGERKQFPLATRYSVPICDSLKLDLSFSLAQPKNDKFTTTGQDCGQNTIYYYQKPDVGLVYSHDVTLNLR